jgi:dUTP pyrophosphatase
MTQVYAGDFPYKNVRTRGFELVQPAVGGSKLPQHSTLKAAAYDFFAPVDIELLPNVTVLVWTGVKAYMQDNETLICANRSSNPIKRNIVLANGIGVIDQDYYSNPNNDGQIGFELVNTSDETVWIHRWDRIGQGMFIPFLPADSWTFKEKWQKRKNGIGSTGV